MRHTKMYEEDFLQHLDEKIWDVLIDDIEVTSDGVVVGFVVAHANIMQAIREYIEKEL